MEQLFILTLSSLISFMKGLPANNPAYMDLLKVIIGSVTWIGGLIGFVYWREKRLKAAVSK